METLEAVMDLSQKVQELLDALLSKLYKQPEPGLVQKVVEEAKGLPRWDVWRIIQRECQSFDTDRIQLVLVAGSVPESSLRFVAPFRQVAWRAIVDIDPDSENIGLHKAFNMADGKQKLSEMWTPEQIRGLKNADLISQIDWKKITWLFANGRREDTKLNSPKEYNDWKISWLHLIGRFFQALEERLDKQKPVATVIMPFRGGEDAPMIKKIVKRLDEGLNANNFTAKHVLISTEGVDPIEQKDVSISLTACAIPANLLSLGLITSLGCTQSRPYSLPTSVKDAKAFFNEQKYLYFREYLDPLYEGCELEDVKKDLSEDEKDSVIQQKEKAFLSGHKISLLSLKYEHDARRTLVGTLGNDIRKQLEQATSAKPTVIELVHRPGTGGSTIARRILWEVHEAFPCAIVREDAASQIQSNDEEEKCCSDICDRISLIEEKCAATPLILIDSESNFFRRKESSHRISGMLISRGKKAVILHCRRGTGPSKMASSLSARVDDELSYDDKIRFRSKYKHLLPIPDSKRLTHVFHFPLCAFLEEFKPRLAQIVSSYAESFSDCDVQIIRFVAFVQKFAGHFVPPSLVYTLFFRSEREGDESSGCAPSPTYEDIFRMLSDDVKFFLVQKKQEDSGGYDLHHIVVADAWLRHLLCSNGRRTLTLLPQYIKELLDLLESELAVIDSDPETIRLFEDMFLHHKTEDDRQKFSDLVKTLVATASDIDDVGALLSRVASLFRNPFYSHLSRFYIYEYDPPQYDKALELIDKGFEACKGEERAQLFDSQGLVHRSKLKKTADIKSTQDLEELAIPALQAYKNAITHSPSWPNPFVGKVQVYTHCLEWILKNNCRGDVTLLLQHVASRKSPNFQNCVSECHFLIGIVERLIATKPLVNAKHTASKINSCKTKLCFLESVAFRRKETSAIAAPFTSIVRHVKQLGEKMHQRNIGGIRFGEKEIKRCQVHFIMHHPNFTLEKLLSNEIHFLMELLLELVSEHKEVHFTPVLFRLGSYYLKSNPSGSVDITLDRCIHYASVWQKQKQQSYDLDPFPWFHLYMFYFVKILDGGAMKFGTKCVEALNTCQKLSEKHMNRMKSYFYLGKGTNLSALIDKRGLKFPEDKSKLEEFWKKESRKKLRELKGRIASSPGEQKIFIELNEGPGVKVYVGKKGVLGRDFDKGQKATFVLSFRMRGLSAHGVVLS